MTGQIKAYEEFLAGPAKELPRKDFLALHRDMVAAFQHERLIHLLVTLFFGFLTILALVLVGVVTAVFGYDLWLLPLYLLTAILVVLEFFYVKHYHFLENHIQDMYKFFQQQP